MGRPRITCTMGGGGFIQFRQFAAGVNKLPFPPIIIGGKFLKIRGKGRIATLLEQAGRLRASAVERRIPVSSCCRRIIVSSGPHPDTYAKVFRHFPPPCLGYGSKTQ